MVSTTVIDAVGFAGGITVASSAPFQLYKSWTTQSTRDISWFWISCYLLGVILIFIYSLLADLLPVRVPLCLEISASGALFLLKVKLDLVSKKQYCQEIGCQTGDIVAQTGYSAANDVTTEGVGLLKKAVSSIEISPADPANDDKIVMMRV